MGTKATTEGAPRTENVAVEHDIQLQLLGAVEQAVREGRDVDDVMALLDQLIEYTNVHFHSEEMMMRLYAFPQYDAHRAEHADLMDQVRAIRDGFAEEGGADLLETVSALRGWLQRHMRGKDRGFETFLNRLAENPT